MGSSNARRIAPAPSPETVAGPSISPSPGSGSGVGTSGIKRASTACQNCKLIKRKCDQHHPCSNCVKTGTECIYDQARDGRRRTARKRNVEELELKRDALDTLLGALRNSDDAHIQQLLQLIRNDAPLDEIIRYASTHSQHIPTNQLSDLAVAVDTGLARKGVLSINALCDTPPIKAPAAPWTTITTDDDLVSHLMSLYFTWYHPAYQTVAQDLFISEMVGADLESKFCSPCLVNGMLGLGCQFSDRAGAFRNLSDPSSRGLHFLEESMRLWMEEARRPRLTTLQAGQTIAVALTLLGRDRMSTLYMDQLNGMANDLLFRIGRIVSTDDDGTNMQKSLSLAMWSLFVVNVGYSLSFLKPPAVTAPSIERLPSFDTALKKYSAWIPYPESEPEIPSDLGQIANSYYDLHAIGADVARFLFSRWRFPGTNQIQTLQYLERQLDKLSRQLPQPDGSAAINPHIMDLNLVYHWIRIILFNFFKRSDSPIAASIENENLPSYAESQCLAAGRTMASLYRRYIHDFGSRSSTMWMPQTAVTAAHMLIDHLEIPDIPDVFHDVCTVITSASRRWLVMKGHVRMIFITAERKGHIMADRTRRLLSHVALESWRPGDHKLFDASTYPNYTFAKSDDPRMAGMGDLLEQWASFNLEESKSRDTPDPGRGTSAAALTRMVDPEGGYDNVRNSSV